MKKHLRYLVFVLLLMTTLFSEKVQAQVPQKMSYQSVIRNSNNALLTTTAVGIRISILQGSPTGTVVFSEIQNSVTNANGLVSLEIGTGTAIMGTFPDVNWANGSYFIKNEVDPSGGTNYTIAGTTELMSVPYAFFSANGITTSQAEAITSMQAQIATLIENVGVLQSQITAIQNTNGLLTMASLTTTAVTNITSIGATTGGTITSVGGAEVAARGVVWDTTSSPTIALSTKTIDGSGTGSFSSVISGLTQETTYYVRAYATNIVGTAYGQEFTITTPASTLAILSTTDVTNITAIGALTGGIIISEGGAEVTARGVVWDTTGSPTIALSTKTINGSGTGSFSSIISGLTQDTTYYIRAYATNSVGTAYGQELTITTSIATLASISSAEIIIITTTSAITGGTIISDGGAEVTARGVVWDTISSPTTALGTKTADGNGAGSFSSTISGLTQETTYYVRAYATNIVGTVYGQELTFTMQNPEVLPSVTIGNQLWQNTNLDVAYYSDGTPIPQVTDPTQWANLTTGAWCYYNNDAVIGSTIGKLYNWYAFAGIHDTDPTTPNKTLAPEGWHVPTQTEWNTLISSLDTNYVEGSGSENSAGGKMKSTGTSLWISPNTAATNESGFKGLPSGYSHESGISVNIGLFGNWWSLSEYDAMSASYLSLSYGSGDAHLDRFNKKAGFSVRCLKNVDSTIVPALASVTTTDVTDITAISATIGGTITSDGGAEVTARGVVWDTISAPTIALTTKTTNGFGFGTFSGEILGLNQLTTYYLRAYATNSAGTAYGQEFTFTTPTTVFNPTEIIGTQIWQTTNLDVDTYSDGTPIPQVTDPTQWANLSTGAWCYYNNDSANGSTYGKLYNWYAVAGIHDSDPSTPNKSLAPEGWHVPSESEWTTLINFLGGESVAGGKMKSTGISLWNSPNTDATNSSLFTGLPGGLHNFNDDTFNLIGEVGIWWSSSEVVYRNATVRYLDFERGNVISGYIHQSYGFSVRCLKN